MLGDAKVDEHGNVHAAQDSSMMYLDKEGEDHEINVSSLCRFAMYFFPLIGGALYWF